MTLALVPPAEIVQTQHVELLNMPPVWVLALVVVPAILLFARWLYRRQLASGAWLPALLRALTLAVLVLFLLHPVRLTQKVAIERPLAVMLLDDSASMRERDLPDLARRNDLPAQASRTEVLRAELDGALVGLIDEVLEALELLKRRLGQMSREGDASCPRLRNVPIRLCWFMASG